MIIDKEELKSMAERLISERPGGYDDPVPAIVVPAADVLTLIAEIERLEVDNGSMRGSTKRMGEDASKAQKQARKSQREICQLKTENEVLRTQSQDALAGQLHLINERDLLKLEIEEMRKDAERYNWAICRVQCAEALSAVVICHDGYKEKINERVDAYMDAWPCPVAALAKEQPK